MKRGSSFVIGILIAILAVVFSTNTVRAQDAAKVDSAHYKVEFENDKVRVLRINYGPGEKSVMHEHPEGVVVFLTTGQVKFHLTDGTTPEMQVEAGQVIWSPGAKHQPENIGDQSFEVIQIEMKAPGEMMEKK